MVKTLLWILAVVVVLLGIEKAFGLEIKGGEAKVTATELWACHVPERSAKILEVRYASFRGRKVYIVSLSRNYTEMDMVLVYPVANDKIGPFPVYYIYDTNRDGQPDIAYADEMGNGICQQMTKVDASMFVKSSDRPSEDPKRQATEPPAVTPPGKPHDEESCHESPKPQEDQNTL